MYVKPVEMFYYLKLTAKACVTSLFKGKLTCMLLGDHFRSVIIFTRPQEVLPLKMTGGRDSA